MFECSRLIVGCLICAQEESPAVWYQERGGVIKAPDICIREHCELPARGRFRVVAEDIYSYDYILS